MLLVSSWSCFCPIYWSQVLSREWGYWSRADRRCPNYTCVINNLIANQRCYLHWRFGGIKWMHLSTFRRRSKKTSKLRVTGLCVGNSPGPVNSPHKWPVTRNVFPFDDDIMCSFLLHTSSVLYLDTTVFRMPGMRFILDVGNIHPSVHYGVADLINGLPVNFEPDSWSDNLSLKKYCNRLNMIKCPLAGIVASAIRCLRNWVYRAQSRVSCSVTLENLRRR